MKTTRALIAFAYVADQFGKTNDLAQGLVPLFAPLISARAGSAFEPRQFVADVKKTYDLDMHPYVAEQFAPALAAHGFLEANRKGDIVHYRNLECEISEPPVREEQLQVLADGFVEFAKPKLKKLGLRSEISALKDALFDRLVRPEFLALLLRPIVPAVGPETLTLRKNDGSQSNEEDKDEQHYDYLVASYMLDIYAKEPTQFDLLVAATSGSLVAEVVLDLQHPPTSGDPLGDVQVAIDSPLVLDALGLGLEGATEYAKQLIAQIKTAGATPGIFDATVEEIRRALKSPLENYERGLELYGPLGRRLKTNPALAPYVRSIIPKLTGEIEDLGIEIFEIVPAFRAEGRKYFTETKEGELANVLGDYDTDGARAHDARAVADVLRIRGGYEVKSISESTIVFVTRNARLARLSRRFLEREGLASDAYFPPCITDRYLAGILWISLGGGGETLSKLRLIANCSAALVPRQDLVRRMHKFFEKLNPDMVERFEALMTNERAEFFLMDRTVNDASLITQDNYEEIYRDIEEVAAERVSKRKDKEIESLKEEHERHLIDITKVHQEKFLEESTKSVELEAEARRRTVEAIRHAAEKDAVASRLRESDQRWANACLEAGRKAGRRAWGGYVFVLALITAATPFLSGDGLVPLIIAAVLSFALALLGSVVGNRFWPGNPIDRWLEGRRQRAALDFARANNLEDLLRCYELRWDENSAVRLEDTAGTSPLLTSDSSGAKN